MALFRQTKKEAPTQVKRTPGGGWDDDYDEPELFTNGQGRFIGNQTRPDLNIKTEKDKASVYHSSQTEPEVSNRIITDNHEYEERIIHEVVQPGGAGLKPSNQVLKGFCNAAQNLDTEIVGCLLLNNLKAEIVWISKARTLFVINELIRNIEKYYQFFRRNIKQLRRNEFLEEGVNSAQLTKLLDDVICYIEEQMNVRSAKDEIDPISYTSTQEGTPLADSGTLLHSIGKSHSAGHPSSGEKLTSQFNTEKNTNTGRKGLPGAFKNIANKSTSDKTTSASTPENVQAGPNLAKQGLQKQQNNIIDLLDGLDFNDKTPVTSAPVNNHNYNNPYPNTDSNRNLSYNLPQNGVENVQQGSFVTQNNFGYNNHGRLANGVNYGNNYPNTMNTHFVGNNNAYYPQMNMHYNHGMQQNMYNQQQQQQNIYSRQPMNTGHMGYAETNQKSNVSAVGAYYDQIDSLVSSLSTKDNEENDTQNKKKQMNEMKFDSLKF